MRVVVAERFGGPEVLVPGEAPDPVAGAGQVVIEVAAVDTLNFETHIRRGRAREWVSVTPPYVPGGGVAGRVVSAGVGVDPGRLGRTVVARTGESGGYAELVAVAADKLVGVPEGLGVADAVALVHDGLTAMIVLDGVGIRPGEWVLVTAAGGGMGTLLVQLARAAGARVVAAARGRRKLAVASELGAEVVVDYTSPGWVDAVRAAGGRGVDVVLDGAGGEIGAAAFEVTNRGGRFSAHGAPGGGFAPVDPDMARERGITLRGIDDIHAALADERRYLERALAESAAGRLRPVIGRTFPLEKAADAHAAIEAREVVGKALLLV